MVTKLVTQYFNGDDCFSVKTTRGFNKAILRLTIPQGCTVSYFYIQKSVDSTAPSIDVSNIYENGFLVEPYYIEPKVGTHTYIIDVSGSTSIRVKVKDDAETKVPLTNVSLCLSQETVKSANPQTRLLSGTTIKADVKEYKSAYIKFNVPENTTSKIRPYTTYDGSAPTWSSKLLGLYYGGVKLIGETVFKAGEHTLYAEFNGETNILLATNNGGTFNVLLTKDELSIDSKEAHIDTTNAFAVDTFRCNSLKITYTGSDISNLAITNQDSLPVPIYYNKRVKLASPIYLISGQFFVDCRGVDKVSFSKGCNVIIEQSDEIISDGILEKGTVCAALPYYVIESGKQVDIEVSVKNSDINSYFYLEGSNDGFTSTTNIPYLKSSINKYHKRQSVNGSEGTVHIYANIEGYKNVRLSFSIANPYTQIVVNAHVYQDYLEGRVIGNIGNNPTNLFTGYKYLKFRFLKEGYINGIYSNANVVECTPILRFTNRNDNSILGITYYDRGMHKAGFNIRAAVGGNTWGLMGIPSAGGFIAAVNNELSNNLEISFLQAESIIDVSQCIVPYEITCYVNAPVAEEYLTKVGEREDYIIYELPSQEQENRDVLNEDVLEWGDNSLTFWHGGYLGVRYDIPFNINNVAHFVDGETIKFAYLLPYKGCSYRDDEAGRLYYPSRIVVFTNSRIFHNFPVRGDSHVPASDLFKFDESIIYNKYKWLPVNDPAKVNSFSKYFPVLKDYDYDQFKYRIETSGYYKVEVNTDDELPSGVEPIETAIPIQVTGRYNASDIGGSVELPNAYNRVVTYYRSNGDSTYTSWKITILDPYGNNGLPATDALQDMFKKNGVVWDRIKYSSMTKCQKYCAFGNYNGLNGGEPVVMMTNNGGRTWYVRACFAVTDNYYAQGPGGRIDLTPITDVTGDYVPNSLRMCRKRFNLPTAEIKEPATPFVIDDNDKSLVTGFTVDSDGRCIVTLAEDKNYPVLFPIVYFENVNASSEWDCICNGSVTASSGGNKIFFRAQRLSANQYVLYGDTGNPNEGDMVCRHIHAVNAVEAGVLISTGESYAPNQFEGGFLYVIKQTEKNGGSAIHVNYSNHDLDVVTRLTSSPQGVNRASGAFLFSDNVDPTLLYVSDESFTVGGNHKRYAALPEGRTQTLPVTPGGIYVGKLSDIDEQSKFKCVCETMGTVVGLTENKGHFAADGHENAICFSKNGFDWTIEEDARSYVNGADNKGNIYFGNKVVVFK